MRKYIKAILILIFWIIRINWINFLKYYNSKSNNVIIFSSLVGKFGNEIFSWDLSAINYHIKNKINWKGPLRALIYFIIRACHREHLETESNLRWKQLAATFYFNGHELKKEEFEKEFFKLSNTEHIPSVGPEIDLIFRSFI